MGDDEQEVNDDVFFYGCIYIYIHAKKTTHGTEAVPKWELKCQVKHLPPFPK